MHEKIQLAVVVKGQPRAHEAGRRGCLDQAGVLLEL